MSIRWSTACFRIFDSNSASFLDGQCSPLGTFRLSRTPQRQASMIYSGRILQTDLAHERILDIFLVWTPALRADTCITRSFESTCLYFQKHNPILTSLNSFTAVDFCISVCRNFSENSIHMLSGSCMVRGLNRRQIPPVLQIIRNKSMTRLQLPPRVGFSSNIPCDKRCS